MSMEDYNYYGDHRVQARDRGNWYSRVINRDTVEAEFADPETGELADITVRIKREVCPTCEGIGSHTNPSIDAGGITASEFDGFDGEEQEGYFSGRYDVPCYECKGEKVILRPCDSETEFIEYLEELEQEQADHDAMSLAERRMGC